MLHKISAQSILILENECVVFTNLILHHIIPNLLYIYVSEFKFTVR